MFRSSFLGMHSTKFLGRQEEEEEDLFIRPTNRLTKSTDYLTYVTYLYIHTENLKHLLRIEKSPAYFRLANNFNNTRYLQPLE